MDAMTNIIYGVISGVIAAFIFEILRSRSNWFPGPSEAPAYVEPALRSDERARNRAKLGFAMFNVFFYFYTFFIVYMALIMPPMFKTLFNENVVYLSDARFVGHLLPEIEIGSSFLQASFIPIALIIYVILLLIVSKVSVPIALVVDKFKHINIYRWRSIQGIVFAFFSACLAILSIYLFNETTLMDAFFTFIMFFVVAMAFASGGQRRT
jgi:hypothetical protein